MNTLRHQVAIVTGATSGIGRATAHLFAREGASVVVTGRREESLALLVSEIVAEGGRAVSLAGDVRNEAHARALVALAESRFGGLDIAFNNAGVLGTLGPCPDIAHDAWLDTLATNLGGPFLGAKHQIPAMKRRGGGSIVFTSSFVGYTAAFPGLAAYAASKAGLIGLTKALAVECAGYGIRVNAILPGGTDTPMGAVMAATPEALQFVRGLHALKRLASPEEQARSVLYLASNASSFVTGTALLVDGGVSIARV